MEWKLRSLINNETHILANVCYHSNPTCVNLCHVKYKKKVGSEVHFTIKYDPNLQLEANVLMMGGLHRRLLQCSEYDTITVETSNQLPIHQLELKCMNSALMHIEFLKNIKDTSTRQQCKDIDNALIVLTDLQKRQHICGSEQSGFYLFYGKLKPNV